LSEPDPELHLGQGLRVARQVGPLRGQTLVQLGAALTQGLGLTAKLDCLSLKLTDCRPTGLCF
jgi:hypothetical protein